MFFDKVEGDVKTEPYLEEVYLPYYIRKEEDCANGDGRR